jgi:capsular exopolysaccharide synthesis family protein
MIVFVAIVTTASALAFSLSQKSLYQATASVLVNNQSLIATLQGITPQSNTQTADRDMQTQALFAQTAPVLEQAVQDTSVTTDELSADSSVTPDTNADVLVFDVQNHDPDLATQLANQYAQAYVTARTRADKAKFATAINQITNALNQIPTPDQPIPPKLPEAVKSQLLAQLNQLTTGETLAANNAAVADKATDAPKIRPTPVKTGIIGAILGLIVGVGLAFLSNALDTRIRSAEDLAEILGLPLLARISAPPRSLQRANDLAMMSEAPGVHAESYRKLRTSFDFANLRHQAQTVMITSALPQEGKSTTIANLAVALARSGRQVALVDLDLRRPILASFFDLEGQPGVTDVVLGSVSLEEALTSISLDESGMERRRATRDPGSLEVLPAGTIPPDPAEFASSPGLADVLADLKERTDVVLVDAPPVLAVSDAMTLSATVDAMIVVARANLVRRPMMTELRRQLAAAPCLKLGFVFTDAEADEQYGYGYYGYEGTPSSAGIATDEGTPSPAASAAEKTSSYGSQYSSSAEETEAGAAERT